MNLLKISPNINPLTMAKIWVGLHTSLMNPFQYSCISYMPYIAGTKKNGIGGYYNK